jgi:nitrate reductase NapAB chaperone NapD
MVNQCHVSRLIIWVRPGWLAATRAEISAIPNVDIPQFDGKAKLIVVLETKSRAQIIERLRAIEALAGVLNVSLNYHHVEEEIADKKRKRLVSQTMSSRGTMHFELDPPPSRQAPLPQRRQTPSTSCPKESLPN